MRRQNGRTGGKEIRSRVAKPASRTKLKTGVFFMKKLKVTFNSPVVLIYALACTVATLIGLLTGGSGSTLLFSTYRAPMSDPLMYLRLFTHVLGHADLAHLVGNMAYILLLGPAIEEKYGARKLVLVMLATALITGIFHNLLFPHTILLGASGIAFAFILLTSFTQFREGELPLTVILVAVIFIGGQIWDGLTVKDHISNLSHIIGGLVGGGAGYLLNRKNITAQP